MTFARLASLAAVLAAGLTLAACSPASGGDAALKKEVESLRKELDDVKLVLKHAARMDVDEVADQIREQLALEEKIHDIPEGLSPTSGPKGAKVTVVEFSDFQCPYCYRRSNDVKRLQETYPNEVRVVFKHFPLNFHKMAPPAHAASMAAQSQGKFWEYRYELASHYGDLSEAELVAAAERAGLDMAKFKSEMKLDASKQARISADMELGNKVGVRGTPTFFVNGKYSRDFSFETVEALLKK